MNNLKGTLSWGQRFALIQEYKLTVAQVEESFGVTPDEISTAREMLIGGTFKVDTTFDVAQYSNIFTKPTEANVIAKPVVAAKEPKKPTAVIVKPTAPRSATKAVKVPQKRGKKGDKIINAFTAIPSVATPAIQFAEDNSVSLAVLRQGKRFDKSGITGKVRVKKDKETGGLMIWRESAE